jgi:hypothetical protein
MPGTDPETAFLELRNSIKVTPVRNSELVKISVFANTPTQAAERANAVARQFETFQNQAAREWNDKALADLEKQIDEQSQAVQTALLQERKKAFEEDIANTTALFRKSLKESLALTEQNLAAEERLGGAPLDKYRQARDEYAKQKRRLQAVEQKFSTERQKLIDLEPAVTLWEPAEARPALPRPSAAAIAAGSVSGLLVGLLLTFLPRPGILSGVLGFLLFLAGAMPWIARVSAPATPPAPASTPTPVPAKPARISVGGDVKSPQLLEYAPDLTVMRAINAAGGLSEYADRKKVRLLRSGTATILDLNAIRADPSKDVPLQPGDSIEVPQSFW